MRHVVKTLRIIGIVLGAIVLIAAAVTGFVIGTTPGGRLALRATSLAPADVSVTRFEGRLAGAFRLIGVSVNTPPVRVHVDTLEVEWTPAALLRRHVDIKSLYLAGPSVELSDTASSEPDSAQASGQAPSELPVTIQVNQLRVRRGSINAPGVQTRNVAVTASGNPARYQARLAADVTGDAIPPAAIRLDASGSMTEASIDSLVVAALGGRTRVSGTAEWKPEVIWDVSLAIDGIDPAPMLPDTSDHGTVTLRATSRGHLAETGPDARLEISTLRGQLRGFDIKGDAAIDVTVREAAIERLFLQWGVLDVALAGNVGWSPHLKWDVHVVADSLLSEHLKQGAFLPATVLTVHARTDGDMVDGVVGATVRIDTLAGHVNDRGIAGYIHARVQDRSVHLDSLHVALGLNSFDARGFLEEGIVDAQVRVYVPDATAIDTTLGGSIELNAHVTGPVAHPLVNATIRARSVVAPSIRVEEADVRARMSLAHDEPLDVDIRIRDADAGGNRIDSLAVVAGGTLADHDVTVSLMAPTALDLGLRLSGGWNGSLWSGELSRLRIHSVVAGGWQTTGTTRVVGGADTVFVDGLVLRSDSGILTVNGEWGARGGSLWNVVVDSLSLGLVDSLITPPLKLPGRAQLATRGSLDATGALRAELRASVDGVVFRPKVPRQIAERPGSSEVSLDSFVVFAKVHSAGANLDVHTVLRSAGRNLAAVHVDAQAPGLNNINVDLANQPIAANANVGSDDLGFLGILSDDIDRAAGRFSARVTGAGTVGAPQLQLDLSLLGGSVGVPALGLFIHQFNVTANGRPGESLTVEGTATSGGGSLQLATNTSRDSAGVNVSLHVKGDHFRVIDTPEARAAISPDFTMDFSGRKVTLRGDVFVPFARVEVVELPASAVTPSADVVYVDEVSDGESPIDIDAELRVELGDSVSFRGFSLYAEFRGGLQLIQRPGHPATGSGELRIVNGRFQAYGQDLTIDPGRIFYAGGPMDNPGLDIRAYREADDKTIAGLRITGTAQQPVLAVYSQPPMSQSNIMSYIVTGRPLTEASGSESAAVAALSVGLQQSGQLTRDIGDAFGLDEARFETGSTVEETSFVAGKYISPKLFVSYGIGLFDRLGTWKFRYSLTRRVTVQTESGRESGGDVYYRFERGE